MDLEHAQLRHRRPPELLELGVQRLDSLRMRLAKAGRRLLEVNEARPGGPRRGAEAGRQRKAAAFARWHEPDESRGSSPDL
jgi:hypothetical protein